jgi:hypothetical protein
MQFTKEQMEWLINQVTILSREVQRLDMHNTIVQNSVLGLGRVMKIPADQFAEAMIGGKSNEEYEKDVMVAFTTKTGRNADGLNGVVAQEIKKAKKK